LHLEIDAGDFCSALRMAMAPAFTQSDEAEMPVPAQFDAGRDQDSIDSYPRPALEFEESTHYS
jgi:hypothetical protein